MKSSDYFFLSPRSAADQPVFTELISELAKRLPLNIAASMIAGPVLAFIMSHAVAVGRIWVWLAILLSVQLISLGVLRVYHRQLDYLGESSRWMVYLLGACVVLDGIGWGLAGFFLYTETNVVYQILLCFFLAVGSAAATVTFSSWLAVTLGFIVANTVPTMIMLFTSNQSIYKFLGIAAVAYLIILTALAAASNLMTTRMMRLRFSNERLLKELSNSHTQLESVNADLKKNNNALQKALQKISTMATIDELTGCHNRRFLMEFLAREKARADRTLVSFSVAIIDLDYFKRINDSYGHIAGDAVLKQVVEIIRQHVRTTDCFARFGGEEFAAVYTATELEEAQQSAERLRQELSVTPIACESFSIYTSVSIGVAEYRYGESVADLLRLADQALYIAKSSGRDRVIAMSRDQLAQPHSASE
jgi:diguanylate cyclase (GGDEF)-like protein